MLHAYVPSQSNARLWRSRNTSVRKKSRENTIYLVFIWVSVYFHINQFLSSPPCAVCFPSSSFKLAFYKKNRNQKHAELASCLYSLVGLSIYVNTNFWLSTSSLYLGFHGLSNRYWIHQYPFCITFSLWRLFTPKLQEVHDLLQGLSLCTLPGCIHRKFLLWKWKKSMPHLRAHKSEKMKLLLFCDLQWNYLNIFISCWQYMTLTLDDLFSWIRWCCTTTSSKCQCLSSPMLLCQSFQRIKPILFNRCSQIRSILAEYFTIWWVYLFYPYQNSEIKKYWLLRCGKIAGAAVCTSHSTNICGPWN